MAEIKNNFLKGRMNQDLDERLIPKGEYKDALNIEVSTSEGANVGTVQTIKGNYQVAQILDNSDYKCIGTVASEGNNRIYWLVSSITKDAIIEWNQNEKIASLVFVDTKKQSSDACLKFGNKIVTGINVLDDFLFFTDNINEPRKINITRSKQGTVNINTHTKLFVNNQDLGDVQEEHITVIKKKPTKAPFYKIESQTSSKKKGIFERVFPRFAYRYKYADGEYSAFGPFTNAVFSANHLDSRDSDTSYNLKHGYNTSMTNSIKSIRLYDFVPADIPEDVIQVDLLYKREDSNVVYTLTSIKRQDPEFSAIGSGQGTRYNVDYAPLTSFPVENHANVDRGDYLIKSENIFSAVEESQILRPWDNVPRKARAQEVTGNRIVYGNYTQGYDFYPDYSARVNAYYEARNLYKSNIAKGGIETVKSLRDYQVGVVFGDKYGRETPVLSSSQSSIQVPFEDSNIVDGPISLTPINISASLDTNIPDWADYYKFYIKETSGEYYNVLMDRLYLPSSGGVDFNNKEDHVWLSIPSSEINKFQEEDYLILKKTSASKEAYTSEANRYKVVDISTEAPDAVKYVYLTIDELRNDAVVSNSGVNYALADGANTDGLFQDHKFRIDNPVDTLRIDKSVWVGDHSKVPWMGTGDTDSHTDVSNEPVDDIYFSWRGIVGGVVQHSKRYRATSIRTGSYWTVKLAEKISFEDARLASKTKAANYAAGELSTSGQLDQTLTFKVERKVLKDGEDFSGKFFAKILLDDYLKSSIVDLQTTSSSNRFIKSEHEIYWWADRQTSSTGYWPHEELQGIVYTSNPQTQPASVTGATGITDTPAHWQSVFDDRGKAFFLDNMPFKSGNPSSEGYAKNSGILHKAYDITYATVNWNPDAATDPDQDVWNLKGGETTFPRLGQTSEGFGSTATRINSLDAVHEANDDYINGHRAFRKDITTLESDETYGDKEGGFFMSLSFFAPGKDLHGGFTNANLSNVDISGENSIASLMQGVWGGGAFTTKNTALLTGDAGQETKFIEFESNYLDGEPLAEAPGPGVGYGYDANYKEHHERQWDPTFSPSNTGNESFTEIDETIQEFISNIVVGSKFKFRQDANEEIYTILDVKEKHFYNHTPWRLIYNKDSSAQTGDAATYQYQISGGNGDYVFTEGNSVEEAAMKWAILKDSNASTGDINQAGLELANTIVNFGKATNRRTSYIIRLDKNPKDQAYNPVQGGSGNLDFDTFNRMEFIDNKAQAQAGLVKDVSAIFETEPKDSIDLNIFYEASQAIPSFLTKDNCNLFAPQGCRVEFIDLPQATRGNINIKGNIILKYWIEDTGGNATGLAFRLEQEDNVPNSGHAVNRLNDGGLEIDYVDTRVRFYRPDGSYTTARIGANYDHVANNADYRAIFYINPVVDPSLSSGLSWYNAFTFGNGVESSRIEDNFNAMRLLNGARASTTLDEPYSEEVRKHGLIYSGIYNANGGVNNLNQFIQAQKITKDLNPTYGSIQKLFSRRADLIAFCEDRVVKILANKDAVFNADGNPNLVATENVLGQATPFVGDFGISTNPESFAYESYRAYFTDKQRGAVLRLSMDGLTPISDAGMKDWFRDNLPEAGSIVGSYDDYKDQYNITLRENVYENLLLNSYIGEGQELSISDYTSEIMVNPNLESGVNFQFVDINAIYNSTPQSDIMDNNELETGVEIIEWPAIPFGSISSYTVTTPATYVDVAQYNAYAATNYGAITVDILGDVQINVGATVDEIVPATNAIEPVYSNSGGYILRNESNFDSTANVGIDQSTGDHYNYKMYKNGQYVDAAYTDTYTEYDSTGNTNVGGSYHAAGVKVLKGANSSTTEQLVFPYSMASGSWPTSSSLAPVPSGNTKVTLYEGEEIFVKVDYELVWKSNYNSWFGWDAGRYPPNVKLGIKLEDGAGANIARLYNTPTAPVFNVVGSSAVDPNVWVNTGWTVDDNPYMAENGVAETYQPSSYRRMKASTKDYADALPHLNGSNIKIPTAVILKAPEIIGGVDALVSGSSREATWWHLGDYSVFYNYETLHHNLGRWTFDLGSLGDYDGEKVAHTSTIQMIVPMKVCRNQNAFTGPGGPQQAINQVRVRVFVDETEAVNGNNYTTAELTQDGADAYFTSWNGSFSVEDKEMLGAGVIMNVKGVSIYKLQKLQSLGTPGVPEDTIQVAADPVFEEQVIGTEDVQVYDTVTLEDGTTTTIGTLASAQGVSAADLGDVMLENAGDQQIDPTYISVLDTAAFDTDYNFPNATTPGFDTTLNAIPGWTEVRHISGGHYLSPVTHSTGMFANEFNEVEAQYGPENPGEFLPIPQDFLDANPGAPSTYYYGQSNGVTSFAPGTTTPITTHADGTAIQIFNGGAGSGTNAVSTGTISVDDYTILNGEKDNGDHGSSVMRIDLQTPLDPNKFYLLDIGRDDSYNTPSASYPNTYTTYDVTGSAGYLYIQHIFASMTSADPRHNEAHYDSPISSAYPDGFFGVFNHHTDGLAMVPTYATEYGNDRHVWRAIFKPEVGATYLDKLDIKSWANRAKLLDVTLIDITSTGSGGTFSSEWAVGTTTTLANALSQPQSYYYNGAWVWNLTSDAPNLGNPQSWWIRYDFDNNELLEPTGQGYRLVFNIDNHHETGNVQGKLRFDMRTTADASGNFKRYFVGNIDKAGTYEVFFNVDSNSVTTSFPSGSSATISVSDEVVGSFGGSPALIILRPDSNVDGFVGAVNNVSIIDETSIVSGGAATTWAFSSPDQTTGDHNILESVDFVRFQNEVIVLDNAPTGTTISQGVNPSLVLEGQTYNVSFNHNNFGQGVNEFNVYYFVEPGLGFFTTVSDEGFVSLDNLEITNVPNYNSSMLVGSLAIEVTGEFNATAYLDNITMTQVDYLFNNYKTISYSEDVKGWVSFKSFIPEQGISVSEQYFTFKNGNIYQHYHDLAEQAKFFDVSYNASITTVLNDGPDIVKTFRTIAYEGTQAKVFAQQANGIDAEMWNQVSKMGWSAEILKTNIYEGNIREFVEKEDKWFNYIKGTSQVSIENLYFQGLGLANADSIQLTEEEFIEVENA